MILITPEEKRVKDKPNKQYAYITSGDNKLTMSISAALNSASSSLSDSVRSRDRVLRVASYAATLISDSAVPMMSGSSRESAAALANAISDARTATRLLDDIPMLVHTLSYGIGRAEVRLYMARINVTCSLVWQMAYVFSLPTYNS